MRFHSVACVVSKGHRKYNCWFSDVAETDTLLDLPCLSKEDDNKASPSHCHGKYIKGVAAPLLTSQRAHFQSGFEACTPQTAEQTKELGCRGGLFFPPASDNPAKSTEWKQIAVSKAL